MARPRTAASIGSIRMHRGPIPHPHVQAAPDGTPYRRHPRQQHPSGHFAAGLRWRLVPQPYGNQMPDHFVIGRQILHDFARDEAGMPVRGRPIVAARGMTMIASTELGELRTWPEGPRSGLQLDFTNPLPLNSQVGSWRPTSQRTPSTGPRRPRQQRVAGEGVGARRGR